MDWPSNATGAVLFHTTCHNETNPNLPLEPTMRTFIVGMMVALPVFGQDVATAVKSITDSGDYKNARWGILIVDSQTGDTVYSRNADQFFIPASVTKLFSCAAAITTLGPDHTFKSPVYAMGKITDGDLDGSLILVAQGDLTFGGRSGPDGCTVFKNNDHTYADGTPGGADLTDTDPLGALKSLAQQVKAAGITTINGDVLIDDRLFQMAEGSGSGPRVISPIIVNDNVIDLTISPGKNAGDRAHVSIRPATKFLNNDIDLITVANDGPKAFRERPTFNVLSFDPQEFSMRGRIPVGTKPIVSILGMRRPADFARTLFIECLQAEGIRVLAPLVRRTSPAELPPENAYANLKPVAVFTSRPFSEMIEVTLKVSHNLYASTLPMLVAAHTKSGRTLDAGLRAEGAALKAIGIDPERVSFSGGAGGGNADHVSPRVTVDLLRAMQKRTEWNAFKAALSVLGVDGTLATSVGKESPARGKVFAKTGTLYWTDLVNNRDYLSSKALAGVMTTNSGRELTFALFLNDRPLPSGVRPSSEGKTLGRICEAVYESVK
jgi:serine-type D-Ala-D-Ala carboxypeptidase/endopeptidase (penicillin-binding protein 4)